MLKGPSMALCLSQASDHKLRAINSELNVPEDHLSERHLGTGSKESVNGIIYSSFISYISSLLLFEPKPLQQ